MSRFDYVKYDEEAIKTQIEIRESVERVEQLINKLSKFDGKRKALDKLEECYIWIGKAIRDDQIERHECDRWMRARQLERESTSSIGESLF